MLPLLTVAAEVTLTASCEEARMLDLAGSFSENKTCFKQPLEIVFGVMAAVDGLICTLAVLQLLRLHYHSPKWTRQKVFHVLVAASNFGYCLYFLINPRAVCGAWPCWSHACGFVLLAVPQILFLATYLLLLSFWVDLCHQAGDQEEEEEEGGEEGGEQSTLPLTGPLQRRRWRQWWRRLRPKGRRAIFGGVVVFVCLFTLLWAVLLWVGRGDNPIDPVYMAELYACLFAALTLLCGGSLAFYGLLLYTKMRRATTGQSTEDLGKVACLAVVCLVCFTFRACLVLVNRLTVTTTSTLSDTKDTKLFALLTLAYYFIGESIPSLVVLIILRDLPLPKPLSPGTTLHLPHSFSNEDFREHLLSSAGAGVETGRVKRCPSPGPSVAGRCTAAPPAAGWQQAARKPLPPIPPSPRGPEGKGLKL